MASPREKTGSNQDQVKVHEYKASNFTMFVTGKNLCDKNIVQQREEHLDQFIMQFGGELPPRYIGISEE